MTKDTNISNVKPCFLWIKRESLANNHLYNKFLNWISGEFDLYLQDDQNGLDVFFPGGKFNINKVSEANEDIVLEINLTSKDKSSGNIIASQIISIHNHLADMY